MYLGRRRSWDFWSEDSEREKEFREAYKTQTVAGLSGWPGCGVGSLELLASCFSDEAMVEKALRGVRRRKNASVTLL